MFQIVKVPDLVLTTPSKPIEKIDKKVLDFIEEMEKTLLGAKNPKGVGLAAPQVGKSLRIFLAKPAPKKPFSVFINPQIIWVSQEKTKGVPEREKKFEGCLSIPNVWGIVRRAKKIKVRYQTLTTNDQRPTTKVHAFTGFLATIVQHEIDHIDGILFTQRVLEQKSKLYRVSGKDKKGNDVFEEIEL